MSINSKSTAESFFCLGPSQWPVIRDGQKITLVPYSPNSLSHGHLVVYVAKGRRICHRLIAKRKDEAGPIWLVKGDSNPWPDGWIQENQIIGRVRDVDGDSLTRWPWRLLGGILLLQGYLSYALYTAVFVLPGGKSLGTLRKKIFPFALAGRVVSLIVSPSVWFQPGGILRYLFLDTPEHRQSWLAPPELPGLRLRLHKKDYGHAPNYETIVGRDQSGDIDAIVSRLASRSGLQILDLAGGAGRLSEPLAAAGHWVTLVDLSNDMLKIAYERRRKNRAAGWEIIRADMTDFSLGKKFDRIILLNNGLEHAGNTKCQLRTLGQIKNHLEPSGICLVDLHYLPQTEKYDGWKTGQWVNKGKFLVEGKIYQLFGRTIPGATSAEVISEHAITTHSLLFTLCRTRLHLASVEEWKRRFARAGLRMVNAYSDWQGSALCETRHRTIFELGHLPC